MRCADAELDDWREASSPEATGYHAEEEPQPAFQFGNQRPQMSYRYM